MLYKKVVSTVSVNHPKTEDRINDVAQYLDRHYGDKKLPALFVHALAVAGASAPFEVSARSRMAIRKLPLP